MGLHDADGIYKLRGELGSPHSYVVRGAEKVALIDTGFAEHFERLRAKLAILGLGPDGIDLVINTHEHADHIGANTFFQDHALVAAHRLAATKMRLTDHWVTLTPGPPNRRWRGHRALHGARPVMTGHPAREAR